MNGDLFNGDIDSDCENGKLEIKHEMLGHIIHANSSKRNHLFCFVWSSNVGYSPKFIQSFLFPNIIIKISKYAGWLLIDMFYNQARRFGISETFSTRSELVDVPGKFPYRDHLWDLWCPAASSKDTCARRAAGWSWYRWSKWRKTTWGHHPWRIHGAGIYANIKGVYWWDPCYHI